MTDVCEVPEEDVFDRDYDAEFGAAGEYDEDDDYCERGPMNPIPIELPADMLDNIAERAARNVHAKVEEMAKVKLAAMIDAMWAETLRDAMRKMAEDLLMEWMTKPRPMTNTYGEATGENMTFSERLLKDWSEYLKQRVNSRGEASNYHGEGNTRLQWLVSQFAMPELEKISKEACQKVQSEARARVQEALSAFLAQQLAPRIELKAIG